LSPVPELPLVPLLPDVGLVGAVALEGGTVVLEDGAVGVVVLEDGAIVLEGGAVGVTGAGPATESPFATSETRALSERSSAVTTRSCV